MRTQARWRSKTASTAANEVVPGSFVKAEFLDPSAESIPAYEIEVRDAQGREWELMCDARTGRIFEIEQEVDTADDPLFAAKAKLTEAQAIEAALAVYPGTVEEVEFEIESNGAATYEIDVITENGKEYKSRSRRGQRRTHRDGGGTLGDRRRSGRTPSVMMDLLKDYLDYAVLGLLGFMSFLMLWLVIERYLYFARLDLGGFDSLDELEVDLTRNLTTIGTIGANAPYIGLLGTVLGILIAFFDMGQSGIIDTNTIMLGLALALKATALGLVVAIPSIVFYNALLRRVDVLKVRWRKEHAA